MFVECIMKIISSLLEFSRFLFGHPDTDFFRIPFVSCFASDWVNKNHILDII